MPRLGRPGNGLTVTIAVSAAIHILLFTILGYHTAKAKEDTVVFSPPYSVSLVSGEEPGEGGQNGVEPPAVADVRPAAPEVDSAVTIPEEKKETPKEAPKETARKEEKAPPAKEALKEAVSEGEKETTEDLESAIDKIRKKIEAEEAKKKKDEEAKRAAEKQKEAATSPTQPGTGRPPAPGKPGGGQPLRLR